MACTLRFLEGGGSGDFFGRGLANMLGLSSKSQLLGLVGFVAGCLLCGLQM